VQPGYFFTPLFSLGPWTFSWRILFPERALVFDGSTQPTANCRNCWKHTQLPIKS
jgi:hypothetical protein